jgi:uncharacterized protein (TIGR03118 family)
MTRSYHILSAALFGLGLSGSILTAAQAGPFVQTNLVSDIPGLATLTEPTLVNPWGISHSTTSPFWISDQGTNFTNLWSVTGQTNVTKVTAVNPPTGNIAIPTTATGPQGPTGQVNNTNTASFQLTPGDATTSSRFIFANLNGTISGWGPPAGTISPSSTIKVTTPGAVYTGLAINQAQDRLYAANAAGTGSIDVFNSSFAPASLGLGAFATPSEVSAKGFVPFNVRDINGQVYVTYAPPGRNTELAATAGLGAVAIFNESGVLQKVLINGSELAAPWGIALAPATFGEFANTLLVGNFSAVESEINAFNPTSGAFIGTIDIDPGIGHTPGGLWSLDFGIGGQNGSPNTLYFTDGIGDPLRGPETHGLFAAITPVPEPSTLALLGASLLSFCVFRRRRSPRT